MGKFVVVYKGGAMAETPEAQEATMQRWMQWFGGLGSSVTDFGNPFGPSVALNRLFGFWRGLAHLTTIDPRTRQLGLPA